MKLKYLLQFYSIGFDVYENEFDFWVCVFWVLSNQKLCNILIILIFEIF